MSLFKPKSQNIPSETFAALDIGSSKVCCAIAKMNREINSDKTMNIKILGVSEFEGYHNFRGIIILGVS